MEKDLTRRSLIKKSIKAGAALGGAALVGYGAYSLLKRNDIEDLYGSYPAGSDKHRFTVSNPRAPRPNIIIIYCDDLGYGDLGCYGSKAIRTPNIDVMAAAGTRFLEYYACNAVCAPSRVGLLTGRYPFRTGIIGNPYPNDEPRARLAARKLGSILKSLGVIDLREDYVAQGISSSEITLASALKAAGYRTGMVGKWHLGDYSRQPEFNPRRHGFDEYFGVPHSNDMVPCPLYRNEQKLEDDIGTNQARITGLYTKEAIKFIDESGGKPFFLYLANTFPHQPLYASKRFEKKSKAGLFGDAVEEIDWSVGEIIALLRQKGLEENTLMFFTSDNGPWFEGSSGGFRGRKGMSYEGGFRVPFIVKWPGRVPGGTVRKGPIMNLDLFPTLLHLAGVNLPRDRVIDGRNIAGFLTGNEAAEPHGPIYFYHNDLLEGVRSGKWKYFEKLNRYVWPVPIDTAPVPATIGKSQLGNRWPLLFDLENDPGESYNVINTYPEVAARLKTMLDGWDKKAKKDPRGFGKGW